MKVQVTRPEFDLFMLFVWDHATECWPFSEACIEEAINNRLAQLADYNGYEVVLPDMGRCWRVKGIWVTGRLYSVEQVKEAFPDDLVAQLEQIQKEGLTLP